MTTSWWSALRASQGLRSALAHASPRLGAETKPDDVRADPGTARAAAGPHGTEGVKPTVRHALPRFLAVGASGTIVNLVVLHLLFGVAGFGFTRSSAVATEIAVLTNYVGNELWTFHHRRLSLRRLVRFNVVSLAALAVTVAAATVLKEFINPYVAQLAGIGLGAAVNFALNFGWTWRR